MESYLKNTNTMEVNHAKSRGKHQIEISATVLREVVNKFIPYLIIKDHRQAGKIKFSCQSLIFTLVLSCICGKRSACAIGKFWSENQYLLKRAIPGMPDIPVSHDTIKRTLESLVFEHIELFMESFALHLLFETLSDLHVSSQMPNDLVPYYKEVLYEYNIMQKERTLSPEDGGSPIKPPFVVNLFASNFRIYELPESEKELLLNCNNVIETVRKFKNIGCCAKASFYTKHYNLPNDSVSYNIQTQPPVEKKADQSRFTLKIDPKLNHNKKFNACPDLAAMASGYK